MALTQERKNEIISEFRVHESDTGSPEVQIAILTEEINNLNEHLRTHKKTTILVAVYSKWLDVVVTY